MKKTVTYGILIVMVVCVTSTALFAFDQPATMKTIPVSDTLQTDCTKPMTVMAAGIPYHWADQSPVPYDAIFAELAEAGIDIFYPTFQYQEYPGPLTLGHEEDFIPPCTLDDEAFHAMRAHGIRLMVPGHLLWDPANMPSLDKDPLADLIDCVGRDLIFGVMTIDEPFGAITDPDDPARDVRKIYHRVNEIDPTIHVVMVHGTIPAFIDDPEVGNRPVTQEEIDYYLWAVENLSNYADIIGFDVYPIPADINPITAPGFSSEVVGYQDAIPAYTHWLKNMAGERPYFLTLQSFSYDHLWGQAGPPNPPADARAPNEDELYEMAMLACAGGAAGLAWWGQSFLRQEDETLWHNVLSVTEKVSKAGLPSLAVFTGCMGGPGVTVPPQECSPFDFIESDLDNDGDVDLHDFSIYQEQCSDKPYTTFTQMIPMRDGTHLATDISLPAGEGPFPVIFIRTPYNKDNTPPAEYEILFEYGIGLVVQDMRGRFSSEGIDCVSQCDNEDGHDSIDWIASQSWSDGQVTMVGGSALGIVQYMLAPSAPDNVKALFSSISTPSLCEHGIFQNGVFRKALVENWLEGQDSLFFLENAEAHPLCSDPFWDASRMDARFDEVNVPAVHYGGWYDIFLQGNLDAFTGYNNEGGPYARGKQKVIIGPWDHSHQTTYHLNTGELFTFPNAENPPVSFYFEWHAHFMDVLPNQAFIDSIPPVQYYVMGDVNDPTAPGNEWRSADNWPISSEPRKLYLHSDGTLQDDSPSETSSSTGYLYDPLDPCPTLGGANMTIEFGPEDQRPIESRPDVLLYQTDVLTEPLEIIGRVSARIYAEADTLDTDIMVRMTDVYPDGKSILIMDGPARLSMQGAYTPGTVVPVDVDLWSTAIVIAPGHRLRISVTSSNYPRYRPNPNDGSIYGESDNPLVANVRIHHSSEHPSYVELPIPTETAP